MFTLVVSGKDGAVVQRLPITKGEWLIGRQEGNAVVLPSPSVSRQHARIYTAQGRCYIQDLGSSNGVYLAGRKIAQVEELQPGQDAVVGDFNLRLEVEGQEPASDADEPNLSTHIIAQDRKFARLVGLNGPFDGEEFALSEKENTIGRTEENLVLLPDPSVSRQHTRVVVEDDGRYIVFDLHSSNGTYVNRKRIQRAVLRDGDVLTIGNVSFRFALPGSTAKARDPGASESRRSILVVALVGVLLIMAGVTVGLVLYKSHKLRVKQQNAQIAYQKAVVAGREAVGAQDWKAAIDHLTKAVEHDPTDRELQGLLTRANAERTHRDALRKGDDLFARGRLEEALKILAAIPGTSAHQAEATDKLKEIRGRLSKRYYEDGVTAYRKQRYKEAHELFAKCLETDPANGDALKRIRRTERKLQRKRVAFEPWSPGGGGP